MNELHRATITVFCALEENEEELTKALAEFIPKDNTDKILVNRTKAIGFNEQPIKILTVEIDTRSQLNDFVKEFVARLSEQTKRILISERESRLDKDCTYFIRIDKALWAKNRIIALVDHGSCFHFRLCIACFPKKRELALDIVRKIFA